ncbi:MAG: hypothetical protein IKN60_04410 [Bacteroidales bacterium]|nr:hypothetical protein [Bacteroidales bacterium]
MANYDNRATVTIGGERYEVAASNGACQIYFDEFCDKLPEPFDGRLRDDILEVYIQYARALGINPAGDEAEDEKPTNPENPENPESPEKAPEPHVLGYEELPQIVGITWAMARAAGSTDLGWDEFLRRFMDASSSNREFRELYNALVIDLAQRAFFHEPEGPEDAQ